MSFGFKWLNVKLITNVGELQKPQNFLEVVFLQQSNVHHIFCFLFETA
jgi:hypothetical protein